MKQQQGTSRAEECLTAQEAFAVLEQAQKGILDSSLPIRTKASPVEPQVNCFYVIDPQIFSDRLKELRSGELQRLEEEGQNLFPMVSQHLDLKTSESLREQSNLRAARSGGCVFRDGRNRPSLICVKYQGVNGKHTEFWWSPEHDFKLGIAMRSMAKVLRKTRAKEAATSQSLEDRKHGFTGKLYSLIRRETNEIPFVRPDGTLVSDLVVQGVPSLVSFCEDASTRKRSFCENPADQGRMKLRKWEESMLQQMNLQNLISNQMQMPMLGSFPLQVQSPLMTSPLVLPLQTSNIGVGAPVLNPWDMNQLNRHQQLLNLLQLQQLNSNDIQMHNINICSSAKKEEDSSC